MLAPWPRPRPFMLPWRQWRQRGEAERRKTGLWWRIEGVGEAGGRLGLHIAAALGFQARASVSGWWM